MGGLEETLNKVMNTLHDWVKENGMTVNPRKTVSQVFSLSTKKHEVHLYFKGEELTSTDKASYLGITLESKLTWLKQIHKATQKGQSKLKLMNRLTGTKWGASQDVLSTAYKSYVRPYLEYGAELLITSSKAALEKLDKVQNQALRIITGGVKSTPITAMELQAGLEPLQDRREKTGLCLYEKLMRREEHWLDYRKVNERLRSHRTFLSKAEEMVHQIDLPTDERQIISISYMPKHDSLKSTGDSNWHVIVSRKIALNPSLEAAALKTIYELYPIEQWLHIYTDGSASGINKGAGAGVYSINFQLSFPVGAGWFKELGKIERNYKSVCIPTHTYYI
nr:uncharacterized protein LOC106685224 [Halyomorpha halys]